MRHGQNILTWVFAGSILLLPQVELSSDEQAAGPAHTAPEALTLENPRALGLKDQPLHPPPNYVPKKPGHYSLQDWQDAIDSTWGPGLPSNEKLSLFNTFWNEVDREFASFQGLPPNLWDSLKALYLPEISDTLNPISRGRFAAIIDLFSLALKDGAHTRLVDNEVFFTQPLPGVPLMVVGMGTGSGLDNSHFGAVLTPLPDSSLLVYRALAPHPLGLVPGDIVLGYDGIDWKDLYVQLLYAQLPMTGLWLEAEPASTHQFLMAAGLNWHLFDTIDVVKYDTGDTLHLATSALAGQTTPIAGTEQLDIAGVPRDGPVSWGIIEGTSIGYIYIMNWNGPTGYLAYHAIDTLMHEVTTTGLIIDIRLNSGGRNPPSESPSVYELLFDSTIETVRWDHRCNPSDHYGMCTYGLWWDEGTINGDSATFYDKPIAVLTGPGCASLGEQFALGMSMHPMAKLFGKQTAGAFNAVTWNDDYPISGWHFARAKWDSYLVGDSGQYLCRAEFPNPTDFPWVDYEHVWLTPDGVASGVDDVAEAAKTWILSRDLDQDGVVNENDNCLQVANADQDLTITMTGDVNQSNTLTSADIIYLVNFVFKSQSAPVPCEAAGDVNCSGTVTAADIIYMVNHVFKSQAPPCNVCQEPEVGWDCS